MGTSRMSMWIGGILTVGGCALDFGSPPVGASDVDVQACEPDGIMAITAFSSNGDLDADDDGNAIPDCDAACAAEFGAGAKAVISDGVNRRPPKNGEPIDWPMLAERWHMRPDGTLIGWTDGRRLLQFPLSASINGSDDEFFAGMMGQWRPNAHCAGWTDGVPPGVAIGHGNAVDEDSMFSHANCDEPRHLLCVVYPAAPDGCAKSD